MYESYWRKMGNMCDITFDGYESLSYFANGKSLCWFLESKLEEEIRRLHNVVGNAIVDDYYVVIGNGSSQLIMAALYALSPTNQPHPINNLFIRSYPEMTDFERSELHKWAGDARNYDKDEPYIEFITSPNNPDGVIREPVDWALVKDKEVARKMIKFMEVSTIGVSKEAQLRPAKILGVFSGSCVNPTLDNFFEYGQSLLTDRWQSLRQVVKANDLFVLQKYPLQYCLFTKKFSESHPAFAWLMRKGSEEDCEKFLKGHKLQTRGGEKFGSYSRNVRISMLGKDEDFNIFLQRLEAIQELPHGN
ncbi:hypothetical protein P3S68_021585 [Capsicum galapagoense]